MERKSRAGASVSKKMEISLTAICALVSYYNISHLVSGERRVEQTVQVREALQALMVAVVEAETSARGYVVTGNAGSRQSSTRHPRASYRCSRHCVD